MTEFADESSRKKMGRVSDSSNATIMGQVRKSSRTESPVVDDSKRLEEVARVYREKTLANSLCLSTIETALRRLITTRLEVMLRYEKFCDAMDDARTRLSRLRESNLFVDDDEVDNEEDDADFIDERERLLRHLDESIEDTREQELRMDWAIGAFRTTAAVKEERLKLRKTKHEAIHSRIVEKLAKIEQVRHRDTAKRIKRLLTATKE